MPYGAPMKDALWENIIAFSRRFYVITRERLVPALLIHHLNRTVGSFSETDDVTSTAKAALDKEKDRLAAKNDFPKHSISFLLMWRRSNPCRKADRQIRILYHNFRASRHNIIAATSSQDQLINRVGAGPERDGVGALRADPVMMLQQLYYNG